MPARPAPAAFPARVRTNSGRKAGTLAGKGGASGREVRRTRRSPSLRMAVCGASAGQMTSSRRPRRAAPPVPPRSRRRPVPQASASRPFDVQLRASSQSIRRKPGPMNTAMPGRNGPPAAFSGHSVFMGPGLRRDDYFTFPRASPIKSGPGCQRTGAGLASRAMAYPDAESASPLVRSTRRATGFVWRWRASF